MTFHAKPAVRYFARPALLAIILPLLCISGLYDIMFLHNTAVSIFCGFDVVQNVYFLAVIIGINIISIFIYAVYWKELHEKCFAKIKICKYEIIWKCVLRKKRVIKIDNCRFIGVESEKSFNGPDYPFIYFSSSPYPTEFSHKINKINNSDKFIKLLGARTDWQTTCSHICRKKKPVGYSIIATARRSNADILNSVRTEAHGTAGENIRVMESTVTEEHSYILLADGFCGRRVYHNCCKRDCHNKGSGFCLRRPGNPLFSDLHQRHGQPGNLLLRHQSPGRCDVSDQQRRNQGRQLQL